MKRKPKVGENLSLLAKAFKSGLGIGIPVVCVRAFDTNDFLCRSMRQLARKCEVEVMTPWGETLTVQRDDLEPQ